MPKRKKPELTIPAAILSASSHRQLRPGEVNTLATYVAALESENETIRQQIGRLQHAHQDAIGKPEITIKLAHNGGIELTFPEQHSVVIPVGLLQHDNAIAMSALMRVLKDRHLAGAKPIGSQGSPTQADLRTILAQAKTAPRRIEPRRPAPAGLSLADLDLDFITQETLDNDQR